MTDEATASDQQDNQAEVHYIKSNFYRVILAEGAFGGMTPRGMIHFALYNERQAIPRRGLLDIDPDSMAATERIVETRGGIVREIETSVQMTLPAAEAFHTWLGRQIVALRKAMDDGV